MARTINGRFRLLEEQARPGGFSDVFKAYDLDSDPLATVAVKVLRVGAHADEIGNISVAREFESLERLHHENIVRLIDADVDVDTGKRFLALEWVDSGMDAYLEGGEPEPDGFIGGIGLQIARAMAFAHENNVAHRDLKPSNVLVASNGTVKVADFGISRVLDWLEDPLIPGATLAHFASPPYAPPERDVGAIGRDVWGLGATLLAGLVRRPLYGYDELRAAREELDVAPELHGIVLQCLADDSLSRPADCRVVYSQLNAFWRSRQVRLAERISVFIGMYRSAVESIDAPDAIDGAKRMAADLRDAPSMVSARNNKGVERHYLLYGDAWAYRVALDSSGNALPRLMAIAAYQPGASEAERAREQGYVLENVEFLVGAPADRVRALDALDGLLEAVSRSEAEARLRVRETEAKRVLDQWRRQIDARTKIERERERPVEYVGVRREGRRATFRVKGSTAGVALDEVRRALSSAGVRAFVRGQVDDVDDQSVTLYLDAEVEGIPAVGKLVVDTQPSRVKIQRERAAVDLLAFAPTKAAREDLGNLLFNPQTNSLPSEVTVERWLSAGLDESKRSAVQAALGSRDLFVVQGPPGTGKTTFIAELVAQELRRDPRAKILISSQTNVALDNALDRIDRLGIEGRIIRLADPKFGRVAAEAERFRMDAQLRNWRKLVEIRSEAFLEEWVRGRGVSVEVVRESKVLREFANLVSLERAVEDELRRLEALVDGKGPQQEEPLEAQDLDDMIQDAFDRHSEASQARTRLEREQAELLAKYKPLVTSNDVSGIRSIADHILGGAEAAQELRNLIELQADWLQRLGRGDGFIAALAQDSSVIGATCIGLAAVQELSDAKFDLCIIDECSKATATETLVPMVRSKRWVLVGDEQQLPPMVEDALKKRGVLDEFQIDETELTQTLFGRLAQSLPMACRTALSEQHRMVKPIGDLISECFYEGQLKSVGPTATHQIAGVLPQPVTWHDTSRRQDRFEQSRSGSELSYVNVLEARVAAELVRQLDQFHEGSEVRPSVLVLAPYAAQVRELRRIVDQLGQLQHIATEVTTVDAVQGREADYVVFTITRSNTQKRAGFLRLDARANVALSRAKSGLAIVGDMGFCRLTETPFKEVAHYVSTHRESCARLEVDRD